jgi:chemotaxis protein methyltransferase CheR
VCDGARTLLSRHHVQGKHGPFLFRNVRICATDIDASNIFGAIVARGVYVEREIKRIPPEILSRYFSPDNEAGHFRISEEIRKAVTFQRHDLLSLKPIRKELGLIICKNVLLHFKETERINVIRMFHAALGNGGFFVTEQTQKMPRQVAGFFEPMVSNAQLLRKVG